MTGQLNGIIGELERQRRVIDQALSALRDVEGLESQAPEAPASKVITSTVWAAHKRNGKRPDISRKKRATVEKVAATPPDAKTLVLSPGKTNRQEARVTNRKQAKKLAEGTMKARTVELLHKVGKPMRSGEVAKRMKITSAYASVNLSQLRRDGFLTHTAAGYTVR